MPERTLYLAADPIQAYLTVRDRHIEPWSGTDEVQLLARRGACPDAPTDRTGQRPGQIGQPQTRNNPAIRPVGNPGRGIRIHQDSL